MPCAVTESPIPFGRRVPDTGLARSNRLDLASDRVELPAPGVGEIRPSAPGLAEGTTLAREVVGVSAPDGRVTRLLSQISDGNPRATEELFPLVYGELRRVARAKMARESPGQTLTPTALVNETYLRLVGDPSLGWQDRGHFFAAAAEAMRRILVERARRKGRAKRGGGRRRTSLDEAMAFSDPPSADILALDEALDRLEERDGKMAAVVKLRYFGGLTVAECASALDSSPRSIDRLWQSAKAWLYRELLRDGDASRSSSSASPSSGPPSS